MSLAISVTVFVITAMLQRV